MTSAPTPTPPRLSGVLGVAFVLGSVIAVSSLQEAHAMWTPDRVRSSIAEFADKQVTELTRNNVPAGAQPAVEAFRRDLVAVELKRRPVVVALALTNFVVGALLTLSTAWALRLRTRGRAWLLQTAGAAIGFSVVQIAIRAALALEQAPLRAHLAAALAANVPGLEALRDLATWRWIAALPPLLVGGIKVAFLVYLVMTLRRPAVRALYRA